ncbi:TonB-dependent receptor domain-containing protein [Sphingosinicella terrae]|uniref:TonB-dependent receptor domain-containing protein n=1 Tax=Sphingosinicella terrae TaxID=2172047 RepID=UPI000E0D4E81|nr:TonB-dependent receptor [Sphingosinicella terrae]
MTRAYLLLTAAPLALATPAFATTATSAATSTEAAQDAAPSDVVTTGVARGRDRLDMAISTSSLDDVEILKLAPRSISDLLRAIPGIRSEANLGEGGASISIRGLPIASSGTKFVQLQEDGLPVLEFGDIVPVSGDSFIRADLNLAQVETIRGGSASTFASNSPGGVINFKSRTGETEGGAVQTSVGIDYEEYRADFAYGASINDGLRFHVGGFYRTGEGPRSTGFDAYHGGQIKLNVTQDFEGGYIRFYGKYLDDAAPAYDTVPMLVSGTDANPVFENVGGFDVRDDTWYSRYFTTNVLLDGQNRVTRSDVRDGQRSMVKAVGLETQFELAGWTVTERFRYSDVSAHVVQTIAPFVAAPDMLGMVLGGPGSTLTYANGPLAGAPVTAASTGNNLAAWLTMFDVDLHGLDNVTNDLRVSRVWEIGGGDLTTTVGVYNSRQQVNTDWRYTSIISEVRGGGEAALIDITRADGTPITQDGFYAFNFALAGGGVRRSYELDYATNAPFASLNYHIGSVAIGGSLRYDFGSASGSIFGVDLGGGRVGTIPFDINGDGIISDAETRVGVTPLTSPAPVDYDYRYLSYSTGINWRIAEPLAVFARYSRGGRANADRILFSPLVSTVDGSLVDEDAAVDFVRQAEAGVKFRRTNLTLNLTGFWAETEDTNLDNATGMAISREYRAMGLEFEGGYRWGPLSLTAGATFTDAEILVDAVNPAVVGNTPRHQAKLIFQATPQYTTDRFSIGATFIGTTGSFAQDTNLLRMPGYVTTNAFVQVRPTEQLLLSLNANNLFNETAFVAIDTGSIAAATGGIASVRPLNGRTVSATARFSF